MALQSYVGSVMQTGWQSGVSDAILLANIIKRRSVTTTSIEGQGCSVQSKQGRPGEQLAGGRTRAAGVHHL